MQEILVFLQDNFIWCFSGVGGALLVFMLDRFFKKREKKTGTTQKIDKSSTGVQAAGSVNINQQTPNKTQKEEIASDLNQIITNNSSGIQAGGDVNINDDSKS